MLPTGADRKAETCWMKPLGPQRQTLKDATKSYFQTMKIYFQALKINFHDVKIDFHVMKIVFGTRSFGVPVLNDSGCRLVRNSFRGGAIPSRPSCRR